MSDFIRVPPDWLATQAEGIREDVHLYWKGFFLARYWMWERLEILASWLDKAPGRAKVLDVGGGLGLMLPTLSKKFENVTLLDLETTVAEKIVERYALPNVSVVKANILTHSFEPGSFDVIIAAAFLEHFRDGSEPIAQIKRWLKPNGLLLVDLPTENWVYRLGRRVGNIQKPLDHYHGASEIRPILTKALTPIRERYIPFRAAALFYQGMYKNDRPTS